MTFSERLKKLMLERQPPLTQQALAEKIGVTQSAVSRWLRHSTPPYPSHMKKLCTLLGVRGEWLRTGRGEKELPRLDAVQEMPMGYTRREKLAFIEERFPEALPMLDSWLESLAAEIQSTPSGEKNQSASTAGKSPGKKGRPISYQAAPSARNQRSAQ